MSQQFDFERLVELCRRTHEETRDSAIRTVAQLAFGRDKHEVRRLAREGQVVEKSSDLIKDPVNYFDRYVKIDGELPTVGILLCDHKNDAVVELTLPEDANVYASNYQLYLPSPEELADQVARVRREIGGSWRTGVAADAWAVDDG